MIEKVIEALKELETEANDIQSSSALTSWKNKATNAVIRIYGVDSAPIEQIRALEYRISINGGDNLKSRVNESKKLIEALIKDVSRFGLPDIQPKKDNGVSINITQHQNQSTKISISLIVEAIQDELKGSQLRELQEVISNKEMNNEEKKSKIVDKLKSFGSDIASNIIANLLTNPAFSG